MNKLVVVATLVALTPSHAQEKQAPPPFWQQGRPPEMAESKQVPWR
jgi:hypothetical protein